MMRTATLRPLDPPEEGVTICSPCVARFRALRPVGALLSPGDALGELEVLGARHRLVLGGAQGERWRVEELLTPRGWAPVAFGEALLRALPWSAQGAAPSASAAASAAPDLPADAVSVDAPIDGLFYASPSPDAPPFVQPGDTIQPGQVIGLIEVMKFFYEIRFERKDSGAVRVLRVVARDGASVDAGAPLLWVAPA